MVDSLEDIQQDIGSDSGEDIGPDSGADSLAERLPDGRQTVARGYVDGIERDAHGAALWLCGGVLSIGRSGALLMMIW